MGRCVLTQTGRQQMLSQRGGDLLPHINKDLPALYALQFENAVLHPRIIFQFFSHFIFIFRVYDQQRTAFIDQRPTHQNKTVINELIDKRRVFAPKRLLSSVLGKIPIGTGLRNYDEIIFHCRTRSDFLSTDLRRFTQIIFPEFQSTGAPRKRIAGELTSAES